MNRLDLVTLVCALGCGLVAGFFYAFSICVMKALGKVPPEQGIAAMQWINVVVINSWFFTTFLGTAVACVFTLIRLLVRWHVPGAPCLLAGSVFYLVGTVLVIMLFNVPRNNALAVLAPASSEAEKLWVSYLFSWTAWNHVRTIAALVAAVLFTVALRFRA